MAATPIALEEEKDEDILEWKAPEGAIPTEFTWPEATDADTSTPETPVTSETPVTPTTPETPVSPETPVQVPSLTMDGVPSNDEETSNAFTAISSWAGNFTENVLRQWGQEWAVDSAGLGNGGRGDNFYNALLQVNNQKNNPFANWTSLEKRGSGDIANMGSLASDYLGTEYFSVDQDNEWVQTDDGVFSLKTGLQYPSSLLVGNDRDLLRDENLLESITRGINQQYSRRLSESERNALRNDPNTTIIPHPARARVSAIEQQLDDRGEGPTGDYGMKGIYERKLPPYLESLARMVGGNVTESGTWTENPDLKNLEGAASVFVGYGIPIIGMELLSKAGLRRLAPTLLQPSLWADRFIKSPTALNLGRVTIPKFITGSTVKVAKGFTEAAIPSAIVTSQIEDDPNTRDIGLTNIERQIAAIKNDFCIGGEFGTTFEFLGPATKPFRQNVTRKVPGTIKDIANEALGGEFFATQKGDSYLDDLAEGIYRLFDFDAAQIQYDRAVDLQQKGPTVEVNATTVDTTKEVLPSTRITGDQRPQPETKPEIIQPKATQKELDVQVEEAGQRLEVARNNAEESGTKLVKIAEVLQPEDLKLKESPIERTGSALANIDRTVNNLREGFNWEFTGQRPGEGAPRTLNQIPALKDNPRPNYVKNNIEEYLNQLGVSPEEIELLRTGQLPIERIREISASVKQDTTTNPDGPFGVNRTQQVWGFNLADELDYLAYGETIDITARQSPKELSSKTGSVVDEAKFRSSFKHLPPEKVDRMLAEIKERGAVTRNPTKIGDKPPTTAAIKSKVSVSGKLRELLAAMQTQDKRMARRIGEHIDLQQRIINKSNELNEKLRTGGDIEDANNILAPTERPATPKNLKRTIERFKSIRYRKERISYESDLDLVVHTIQGASTDYKRPKSHDALVNWVVRDLGIDWSIINEVGADIRAQVKANRKTSPTSILRLKDTEIWKQGGDLDLMLTYHGTGPSEFDKIMRGGFDKSKVQVKLFGEGIYTTTSRKEAVQYAQRHGGDESTIVEIDIPEEDLIDVGNWSELAKTSFDNTDAYHKWNMKIRGLLDEGKDVLVRGSTQTVMGTPKKSPDWILFGSNKTATDSITNRPRIDFDLEMQDRGELGKGLIRDLQDDMDDLLGGRDSFEEGWDAGIPLKGEGSWETIADNIHRVGGVPARLEPEFWSTVTAKQARDYKNLKVGQKVSARGAYSRRKGIVVLAMMHKGHYTTFDRSLKTAWHEAFHALQDRVMTEAEIKILDDSRSQLKELVLMGFDLKESFVDGLSNREMQAWAFAAWESFRPEYKETTWAKPLEKLRRILEAITNKVFKKNYDTWEELFEAAERGALADRTGRPWTREFLNQDFLDAREDFVSYEIDPDDLVEGMRASRDGIEDGSKNIENEMKSETRRLISRSGKTDYIARDSKDLIAMNSAMEQAIREGLGDRAEVTGMPAWKTGELFNKAARQVQEDGYGTDTTIFNYEHARKGDFQSKDDLYAAAGILHHRETNLEILTKASIEYESAQTDADAATAGKRMFAALEDQLKLDIAWTGVTRKAAQIMRIAQTSHESALAASLPVGTEFKQTVAPEVAKKAIKEGFTPVQGMLGEGVYFSTSATPGPVGSTELYGRLLGDVSILDLSSSYQRVTDLLRELNLGKAKKDHDGFQLTPKQEAGIRDYVIGEGYAGIRYGTDFLKRIPGEDQIIIYDVNTANRLINSDAAIPPPKEELDESVRTLINNSLKQTENLLEKRIPKDIRDSIAKGELTPEVREILDGMKVIAYHLRNTPGAKKEFAELVERIPAGEMRGNAIANLIRNMLFFSVRTWMKVFLGTGYRAATLPLTQMIGTSRVQLRAILDKDPQAFRLATRRQHLNMMLYPKYLERLPYAVRMMVASLRHNETFVNVGRNYSEMTSRQREFTPSDQLELDFMSRRMKEEPRGNEYWLQGDTNPIALAARATWDGFSTASGRVMGGLDSFWAGMVGPSTEWARLMEMNLFNADTKGFEPGSEKAWIWASEQTDKMLRKHFQDIDLANGEVIKDGRLVGKHAKKAMDWVNYTDDVQVGLEKRDYDYGVRKAREEGLTDPQQIMEYANAWVKEDPEDSQFREWLQQIVNAPGVATQHLYGKNIWRNTAAALIRPTNRTPVNLVKSAMRMLPGLNQTVDSFRRDIHSEDFFTRERALGEVGMGFTTLAFGTMLVNSGYVQFSGPPSFNPQERFEADRAGWQPWSLRLRLPGGEWSRWFDITMFDTAANVFGTIGAYTENVTSMNEEQADNFQGFATVALAGTAKEMTLGQFTKTALGSLTDISDLIVELQNEKVRFVAGSRHAAEKFLTDRLAMFWPAFANAARNSVDPVRRQINASKLPFPLNMMENAVKTVALRTPGLSETQPAYLHPTTGEPIPSNTIPGNRMIPKDQPWLRMFHDSIVPWGVTKTKGQSPDPVDIEMLRIQGRGGTFQIWNRRMFNLNDRVLDTHELNRLIVIGTQEVVLNGMTLHEALQSKIQSLTYDSLPTNDGNSALTSRRAIALYNVIEPYKEEAKLRFMEETDVPGGIGFEIKKQKALSERMKYEAEYGINTDPSRLDALRQLAN